MNWSASASKLGRISTSSDSAGLHGTARRTWHAVVSAEACCVREQTSRHHTHAVLRKHFSSTTRLGRPASKKIIVGAVRFGGREKVQLVRAVGGRVEEERR